MSSTPHALTLAARGDIRSAFPILSGNAERGDGEAALVLAQWRMAGDLIRRDLAESRRYYGIAAKSGVEAAEECYIALLANGAGDIGRKWQEALERLGQRPDARSKQQLQLIAAMDLDEAGDPMAPYHAEVIRSSPEIKSIRGFLSKDECAFLADLAGPRLKPAVVVHPQTGALINDPIRRSLQASFPFVLENPFVHALNRRIAHATATTYAAGEPLQILAYSDGQEYRTHSDVLPNEANQREWTFLVRLSEGFDGGETYFPKIDWSYDGELGDAVLFRNVDTRGNPDPLAWHAGRPVTRGTKIILSKWIRRAALSLAGPPGRPF